MDKQTFCSSQTTSNTARYAAALYRQGTWVWLYPGRAQGGLGLGISPSLGLLSFMCSFGLY